MKSYKFKKKNLPKIIENNKVIFNTLQPNLRSTPIIDELISLGAFVGDLSKKTDLSQHNLIKGYRNNISFYDITKSIDLLTKATRFLKSLKKKEDITFIVVANSNENDTQSIYDFKQIKHRKVQFFTQKSWPPGYISKTKETLNTVLVVDDITLNRVAFEEGVNAKIPVVAFLSPACNLNGVDYPVPLNLKNNRIWFVNYCKTLLKNKK
jgi:ribosomal protein S2